MKKLTALIAAVVSIISMRKTYLIGVGTAFIFLTSEVNAEPQRLICDLKTHTKYPEEYYWKNLSNRTWFLEIDNQRDLIKKQWGKNFQWTDDFKIISTDPIHLVAVYAHQSVSGNAKVSAMALNLDTGKMTYSDHFTKSGGGAFTLHYGTCKKGY